MSIRSAPGADEMVVISKLTREFAIIDGMRIPWKGVSAQVKELRAAGVSTVAADVSGIEKTDENLELINLFVIATGFTYSTRSNPGKAAEYFGNVEWIELKYGPESGRGLVIDKLNLSLTDLADKVAGLHDQGKIVHIVCEEDLNDTPNNRRSWEDLIIAVKADLGIRNLSGQPGKSFQVTPPLTKQN